MNRISAELTPRLAACVEAAACVPEGAVVQAQQRLLARVAAHPARARVQARRWVALAAAASLAALALLALPLLRDEGQAFAAVLRHFQSFKTLQMVVEQHVDGRMLQRSIVWTDARGRVRTDVGSELTVMVDPVRRRVVTLLHGPKQAVVGTLPAAAGRPEAALDWLEELRRFQGQARRLPQPRLIDSRRAQGWSLTLSGQTLVLWADAQGLPVAMEQASAGPLELRYRFAFDVALPPGGLEASVPAGYAVSRGAAD